MGNWTFLWVQIIGHHKVTFFLIWSVLSMVILTGLFGLDVAQVEHELMLLFTGLLVISISVGLFLESLKIGVLQFVMSVYVLAMTLGCFSWLALTLNAESVLGLMVLITVLSSNLVYVSTSLSKEMARGLFQFDALAEALKLNVSPILLSNLTTALGFVFVAYAEPDLVPLSALVSIGVFISLLTILSWLPWLLLNWLLEFRVGGTKDRHGLASVATFLAGSAFTRVATLLAGLSITITLLLFNRVAWVHLHNMAWLLLAFSVVFLLFWQSLKITLLNLALNIVGLMLAVSLFLFFYQDSPWVWLLWVVPIGIVIDDGVHFFSRFLRAKRGVFNDNKSAVIYSMASVGRPIWITSWALLMALVVLSFAQSDLVIQASVLTMITLVLTTLLVLWVLPALLLSKNS